MVEDVILEDKPFDSYKEELKKCCEQEDVSYEDLECILEDFLESLNIGIKSPDDLAIAMGIGFALKNSKSCFVREEKILELMEMWNEHNHNREFSDNSIDIDYYF